MGMNIVDSDSGGQGREIAALDVAGRELPLDRHPLAVYAAGLPSPHSRRGVTVAARRALAALLERPREEIDDQALTRFPWERLRYQHVAAIRSRLIAKVQRS